LVLVSGGFSTVGSIILLLLGGSGLKVEDSISMSLDSIASNATGSSSGSSSTGCCSHGYVVVVVKSVSVLDLFLSTTSYIADLGVLWILLIFLLKDRKS
jgi:hypothetical protein